MLLQSGSCVSLLEGLHGSGKSTLVGCLLASPRLQGRFVDGVIVIHVGATSSLPAVLLRVYDTLVYLQAATGKPGYQATGRVTSHLT